MPGPQAPDPAKGDVLHLIGWGSRTITRAHRSSGGNEVASMTAVVDASGILKFTAGFLDRRICMSTHLKTDRPSSTNIALIHGIGVPEESNLVMDIVSLRQRVASGLVDVEH